MEKKYKIQDVRMIRLPISRATHSRIAIRAPVLRPTGRKMASAEQVSNEPPVPHEHTRMLRVVVLLWAG